MPGISRKSGEGVQSVKEADKDTQLGSAGAGSAASDEKRKPAARQRGSNGADVGNALRAVYQDAVGENVPDEMLDLLSKLQ